MSSNGEPIDTVDSNKNRRDSSAEMVGKAIFLFQGTSGCAPQSLHPLLYSPSILLALLDRTTRGNRQEETVLLQVKQTPDGNNFQKEAVGQPYKAALNFFTPLANIRSAY